MEQDKKVFLSLTLRHELDKLKVNAVMYKHHVSNIRVCKKNFYVSRGWVFFIPSNVEFFPKLNIFYQVSQLHQGVWNLFFSGADYFDWHIAVNVCGSCEDVKFRRRPTVFLAQAVVERSWVYIVRDNTWT